MAPSCYPITLLSVFFGATFVFGHVHGPWLSRALEPDVVSSFQDVLRTDCLECAMALLQTHARIGPPQPLHQTGIDDLELDYNPSSSPAQQPAWTYADAASWPEIYPACSEGLQSPIDISAKALGLLNGTSIQSNERLAGRVHYQGVSGGSLSIKNGGHSVQVAGMFGILSLPGGDYVARLFHFHFPAEHTIYGEAAAGELHIVHTRVGATDLDGMAVVAIQLQDIAKLGVNSVTTAQVKFLQDIGFPDRLPSPNEEIPLDESLSIDLGSIFAEELAGPYYHYEGSLTSPPCPGHTHWYVLQNAAAVDIRMIEHFKALFPSHMNNRPLQQLGGRKVTISKLATDDHEFD